MIDVFQLIPILRADLTARFLHKLSNYNAHLILDLEDGLWDLFDASRTPLLKVQGRERLADFFSRYAGVTHELNIGFRVNNIHSNEFTHDMAALRPISDTIPIACIVLPKVNSPQDIFDFIDAAKQSKIRYLELVPIIESEEGIRNLKEITAAAANAGLKHMIYGHYDYSLDAGHWPFLEQDEQEFWDLVSPIVETIENGGLEYIHTPVNQLNDAETLTSVVRQLKRICRNEFGMLSVGVQQTHFLSGFPEDDSWLGKPDLRKRIKYDTDELIRLAQATISTYRLNRRENYGFVVDSKSGRFISPHEYLAAVRFMETNKND